MVGHAGNADVLRGVAIVLTALLASVASIHTTSSHRLVVIVCYPL
jgi:hypothetical protein